MTPKAECESLAAALGATLRISGGRYWEVCAEAPAGQVWKSTRLHELVQCSDPPFKLPAQCWRELAAEMRDGIEKCEVEHCDWCNA